MSVQAETQKRLIRLQPVNPDKTNTSSFLARIFYWSNAKKYADDQIKATFKELVDEGLIESDDKLREAAETKVILESPSFKLLAKVNPPRKSFDKDLFINLVHEQCGVSKLKLKKLAEESYSLSKAPLTKQVIES